MRWRLTMEVAARDGSVGVARWYRSCNGGCRLRLPWWLEVVRRFAFSGVKVEDVRWLRSGGQCAKMTAATMEVHGGGHGDGRRGGKLGLGFHE